MRKEALLSTVELYLQQQHETMDLLRSIPYDAFRAIEQQLKPERRINLEMFADAIVDASRRFQFEGDHLSRRNILYLFHQIDFQDKKYITWEELTMHMIEDSFKNSGSVVEVNSSSGPSRSELASVEHVVAAKQNVTARVRHIKYIEPWDRLLRVVHVSNSQESVIELTSVGSLDHVTKHTQKNIPAHTIAVEAITDHNLVVASHTDLNCTVHAVQLLREGPTTTNITLQRTVTRRETEESATSFLWHPEKLFLSGFRSGSIAPWNLRLDRPSPSDRFQINERFSVFDQGVSCMIPFEDKIVATSVASEQNIALVDVHRGLAVERLKGHTMGVLAVARSDFSDLIVSAGFERVPYVWVLKLRDFPPWKLYDKAEPHRGDITNVIAPFSTNKIITSDDKGLIKLWDIRTFKCVQSLWGDLPPPLKPGVSPAGSNHFHCTTFHSSMQTILSAGPSHIHTFRGNTPQSMDCTDDQPMAAMLHHPTLDSFYTAHERTVKVWSQSAGAISCRYTDIAPSKISAMCFDSRKRKFFIGTVTGELTGHNVTTGSRYRTFRSVDSEIVALAYGVLRNGARCLLGITRTEMVYFDDSSMDGRQQVISHILQNIKLLIMKNIEDQMEAEKRARVVVYRGIACQSKLSLAYVWARWYVIAVDLYSMSVVHSFDVEQNEVVAVCALGDLPAVAILDHTNTLYVYAVRPSLMAGTMLLKRDLNQVDSSTLDKRSRQSFTRSRKISMRLQNEQTFMKAVANEFVPDDDTAPMGQIGCLMAYHQGRRTVYITDSNGVLWEWSIDEFIRLSGLTSAHYPMQSISDTLLRKRYTIVGPAEAYNSVRLVKTFQAHQDEIRFLEIVFHNSATRIITGGADQRVIAWDSGGTCLGELSQGRFLRPDLLGDQVAVAMLYSRQHILPWRFDDAPPDNDLYIIDDIPPKVLLILRKLATRFRAKTRDRRNRAGGATTRAQASPSPPAVDCENSGGGKGAAVGDSNATAQEKSSDAAALVASESSKQLRSNGRARNTVFVDASASSRLDGSGKFCPDDSFNNGGDSSPTTSTILTTSGFESAFDGQEQHANDRKAATNSNAISSAALTSSPRRELQPKNKFRVRGAYVRNPNGDGFIPPPPLVAYGGSNTTGVVSNAAPPVAVPPKQSPRWFQNISQRNDLPLNTIGTSAQELSLRENKDRSMAQALHMEWHTFSRLMNTGHDSDAHAVDLSKTQEAMSMRRVFVPQLPQASHSSRSPAGGTPQGGRQGRLPLTARDQEKFAIARLLGDIPCSSTEHPASMDEVTPLSDRGRLR